MKKLIERWLAPVTLLEWGGVFLYFYLSGRLTSFLHPSFRPQVFAVGILLVASAFILIFTRKIKSAYDFATPDNNASMRSPVQSTWIYPFMLLLPLALAAGFTQDAYGVNILTTRGIIETASSLPGMNEKYAKMLTVPPDSAVIEPNLPSDNSGTPANPPSVDESAVDDFFKPNASGNMELNVADLLYAAEEPSLRAPFEGKAAEMVGQFMPAKTNNANGNRFKLVRLFMTCCASDAQPISLMVEYDAPLPAKVTDMAWTKVTGSVSFPLENGRVIALFRAKKVELSEPPEESMLY